MQHSKQRKEELAYDILPTTVTVLICLTLKVKYDLALTGSGVRASALATGVLSALVENKEINRPSEIGYVSCAGGGAFAGGSFVQAAHHKCSQGTKKVQDWKADMDTW